MVHVEIRRITFEEKKTGRTLLNATLRLGNVSHMTLGHTHVDRFLVIVDYLPKLFAINERDYKQENRKTPYVIV